MATVIYGGNAIIPAPIVSISKKYQKTANGKNVGAAFDITITGTLLAYKGSPTASGTMWTQAGYPPDESVGDTARLAAIMRKQETLRVLFATEGQTLEFQSADGSAPMKCNPRITGINFAEGIWYQTCAYTITAEADVVYINGLAVGEDTFSEYISEATENWNLETNEDQPESATIPRTYRLSHTVGATGKRYYDDAGILVKEAWEWAKTYVQAKLGFVQARADSVGALNLSGYGGYNFVRVESTDINAGSYSVTESWILTQSNALEQFEVSIKTSVDTGISTVNIDGSITGLEQRDANLGLVTTKYANADTKWTTVKSLLLSRAQTYSDLTLNVTPITTTVGRNPTLGTISYSYEYNTRPSNIVTNARSESITITDSFGADIFASIFILGRAAGPLLQNLGTVNQSERTISIELVMPAADFTLGLQSALTSQKPRLASTSGPLLQAIIDAANPTYNGFSQVFMPSQSETWEPKTGRYTYNCTWVYEL